MKHEISYKADKMSVRIIFYWNWMYANFHWAQSINLIDISTFDGSKPINIASMNANNSIINRPSFCLPLSSQFMANFTDKNNKNTHIRTHPE